MPFNDLDTVAKARAPEATISYSNKVRKTGRAKADKTLQLTISIGTAICGTPGAKAFKLQIGSGQDAGKLRIVGLSAEVSGVIPTRHGRFHRWNFGFVPRLGDDQFQGEKRPVRKTGDDEFEIDVPTSWFEA
jgi:hypothetical protein